MVDLLAMPEPVEIEPARASEPWDRQATFG
jgi:hypothetical protein